MTDPKVIAAMLREYARQQREYGRVTYATEIEAQAAAVEAAGGWVDGECIEAGHDEEGKPRMLIYCTQEALRDGPALVYRMVRVTPLPAAPAQGDV